MIQNFDAIAAKYPGPKERLFATSRGLIQFCTADPQQFGNVFFGPENRNGIRAGQFINDLGAPLFGRFVQLFFDVAKDEGLPSKDDIVVAHTWWFTILASPHSWSSKVLCLTCLIRLSWSSKRSLRCGRAFRLFRDCRRAWSLSDPADRVPQRNNSSVYLGVVGDMPAAYQVSTVFPRP